MMLNFPTTIIDDFFENVDDVLNIAYSDKVDWKPAEDGSWPGIRSQKIVDIDSHFFHFYMKKFLNIYYTHEDIKEQDISFKSKSYFHRADPKVPSGYIHSDFPVCCTSLIYLTRNADVRAGTSFYTKKDINEYNFNGEWRENKLKYYSSQITPEEAEPYIKHNNSNFVKDTWVGYKFNRFLNFDSHIWHGVEDYNSNTDEERLTMVTFVDAITVDNKPITRMRQIQK